MRHRALPHPEFAEEEILVPTGQRINGVYIYIYINSSRFRFVRRLWRLFSPSGFAAVCLLAEETSNLGVELLSGVEETNLVVTSALLVETMFATRNECLTTCKESFCIFFRFFIHNLTPQGVYYGKKEKGLRDLSGPCTQFPSRVIHGRKERHRLSMVHSKFLSSFSIRLEAMAIRWEAKAIGWEAIAIRLVAIAIRLEAIAIGWEAIAIRLVAIAIRLEAIAIRLEAIAIRLEAKAIGLEAIASRLAFMLEARFEAIAIRMEAIAIRSEGIAIRLEAIAIRLGHRC